MPDIFISFSPQDEAFARQLAVSLSDMGATVWIDIETVPHGMRWRTAIDPKKAFSAAEAMIVVISPDAMTSGKVAEEWQNFRELDKPIITVLWRPAKMHFQLSRIQYIDFQQMDYDEAFDRLHIRLEELGIRLNMPAPDQTQSTLVLSQLQEEKNALPRQGGSNLPMLLLLVVVLVIIGGGGLFVLGGGLAQPTETPQPTIDTHATSTAEAFALATDTANAEATIAAYSPTPSDTPTDTRTPSATPTPSDSPTPTLSPTPTWDGVRRVQALQDTNVRELPNVRAERVAFLFEGSIAQVLEQDSNGWYRIVIPGTTGLTGWVGSGAVEEVEVNPTITPTATPR